MALFFLILYGLLAASGALFLESFSLAVIPEGIGVLPAFLIGASFIEEIFKWLLLARFAKAHPIIKHSPLLIGFVFGLGFFIFEFGLITSGYKSFPLLPLGGILLVHLVTSVVYAWGIYSSKEKGFIRSTTLILAMTTLHALYNFLALR